MAGLFTFKALAKYKAPMTKRKSNNSTAIILDEPEYRVGKDENKKQADIESLMKRKADNEKLVCSVHGCLHHRYSISLYCHHHKQKNKRSGHPTLIAPNAEEMKWATKEGEKMLDHLYTEHGEERVRLWIRSAAKHLIVPASKFLIKVHKIDPKLTQKSQACIILAHYQHKAKQALDDAIVTYLFLRLYVLRKGSYYGPLTREAWVNTQVGRWIRRKARMQATREVYSSKPVAMPSWYLNEQGKHVPFRYEETSTFVKDNYLPNRAIYKTTGSLVQQACAKETLLGLVDRYYQHLQQIGEADAPSIEPRWSRRRSLSEYNSLAKA